MGMTSKTFDCVEMKKHAQEELMKEFEGLTKEEQLEYLQNVDRKIAKERLSAQNNKTRSTPKETP